MARKRPRYLREGRWPRWQRKAIQRYCRSVRREIAREEAVGPDNPMLRSWRIMVFRAHLVIDEIELAFDRKRRGVILATAEPEEADA